MSSIGSVVATSYTPQSTPTGGVQGAPRVSRSRGEDDGEDKKVHRHGHHGHERGERAGSLQDALVQAFKSLGLSMPQTPQGGGNPPAAPAAPTDGATTTTAAPTGTASAPATTAPVAPPPMRHGAHEDHEDDDDDDDHHRSAATGIQADIRQFMHALFQAVKGLSSESGATNTGTGTGTATGTGTGTGATAGTGTATPAATTPPASTNTFPAPRFHGGEHSHGHRRHFAAGLAALISQIGNGSAPPALQSAFDKLVADLQGTSGTAATAGTSGSAGATGTPGATATPPAPSTPPATDTAATTGTPGATSGSGQSSSSSTAVTLQALLSKLQQSLGYGAMGHRAAIGNLVNVTAG